MTAQAELKTRDKVCHHLPLSITITCNYVGGSTHLLEGLKHDVISLLDQKFAGPTHWVPSIPECRLSTACTAI